MKKLRVLLSVLLVICMVVGFAPMHGTASAAKEDWEWYWTEEYRNEGNWNGWSYVDGWYELSDKWYQVDFSPVTVPVELNASGTVSNGPATAAGSTTEMVGTSFSYFFNEWAGTLIIRGTGEMPAFSKEYPAPWANLKDKVARVIFERNITRISSNAFVDFSRLRSVVFPATLKAIDPDAFLWSDETRALKNFQKLDRIEYSGDLDVLDKVLTLANIQDLLDARIVKVTEKAVQDEIWQLTWYRIRRPIRVKYDRAGRPILIERVDKDGKYFRTSVTWDDTLADGNIRSSSQPTSPDTVAAGQTFTRDVIEKRETYSVNPNGVENLYEFEKNDLGQTTYFASFHLADGEITGGTQTFADETGVTKTGTLKSIEKYGDYTYRLWENVLVNGGGIEQMLEILDKFGRVSSISTSSGDSVVNTYDEKTGLLNSRSVFDAASNTSTEYTYNYTNYSLDSVSAETTDNNTGTTSTNTIKYTYNDNGSMDTKVQTEGTKTVTTLYNTYNRAKTEVITDSGDVQYIYEYAYDADGVVTQRTVKNKDGKVIGIDTFEAGHIVKSVREVPAAAGTKSIETTSYSYSGDGALTGEKKEVITVAAKSAAVAAASAAKMMAAPAALGSAAAASAEDTEVVSAQSTEGTGETKEAVSTLSANALGSTASAPAALGASKMAFKASVRSAFKALNLDFDGKTDLNDEDFEIISASSEETAYDEAGNIIAQNKKDLLGDGDVFGGVSVEIQDGKQVSLNTFIDDNTGEESVSDTYSKKASLEANRQVFQITESSKDFSDNTMEAVHSLGIDEKPLASTIKETPKDGTTIVTDSTFVAHSDGTLTESQLVFEEDSKETLGSSVTTHPALENTPVAVVGDGEGEEEPAEQKSDVVVEDQKDGTVVEDQKDDVVVEDKKDDTVVEDQKDDTVVEVEPKEEASDESGEVTEPEDQKADIVVEDKKDDTLVEDQKDDTLVEVEPKEEPKEEASDKSGEVTEPEDQKADIIVEDKKDDTASADKSKEKTKEEASGEKSKTEAKKADAAVEDIPEEPTPKAEPVKAEPAAKSTPKAEPAKAEPAKKEVKKTAPAVDNSAADPAAAAQMAAAQEAARIAAAQEAEAQRIAAEQEAEARRRAAELEAEAQRRAAELAAAQAAEAQRIAAEAAAAQAAAAAQVG